MKVFYPEKHRLHSFGLPGTRPDDYDANYECPERLDSILVAIKPLPWVKLTNPDDFGMDPIKAVHTELYLDFLKHGFENWKDLSENPGMAYIPYSPKIPVETFKSGKIPEQDGFFATDLYVPVNAFTWQAALVSANCALSAAQRISNSDPVAVGLCRPPGHHAGAGSCGGFCYLNNAAIAAQQLSKQGKVAILDIDYHAGNGTQSIFYDREDVLFVSLHADPSRQYPFFAGFADQKGSGPGLGLTQNFPLPGHTSNSLYLGTLEKALGLIEKYSPTFLVLSAGFDTFKDDPLGDFELTTDCYANIGRLISKMGFPTAIILEGGYNIDSLGMNIFSLISAFVKT